MMQRTETMNGTATKLKTLALSLSAIVILLFPFHMLMIPISLAYAHDLEMKVVEGIKENPMDEVVKVTQSHPQPVFPLVQNGTVDFGVWFNDHNVERQEQVASNGFEIGTRSLTKVDSGINDFEDLKGKRLVTTAGTTSEARHSSRPVDEKDGYRYHPHKDHGEGFL
jgi:glutamate/aspartate transport system substrate-binding protein